jgi:hypothetical protein
VPVILFRHPVSRVFELGAGIPYAIELVAVPTVLDSRMSPAFCPTTREVAYGRILDLSGDLQYKLRFEVVHPMPRYRTEDIFRVGQITSVPARGIKEARKLHLSLLRDIILRADYGAGTDGDLL